MSSNPVSSTSNPASALFAAINAQSSSSGTSSTSATSSSSSSAGSPTSAASIQANFLQLLTTQLQNQDPLNPMDNSQMTSQLAQISTVDGIQQLNTTLTQLINGQTQSQTLQAAALVGQGVLVPSSSLTLSNGTAVGGIDLASAADAVTLQVKDASGQVVRTMQLGSMDAGAQGFSWDGTTDSGTKAPDGHYTMAVTATQGSNAVTATALGYGQVSSVASTAQGLAVEVGGLGSFALSDVKQIM
jgi:flagellar basal-body rod modification protein FlgD